jgi:hypothetical protein
VLPDVGSGRPGGIHDVDETDHAVVNVAAHGDDPGLVEADDARLVVAVEFQFKGMGRGKRIDVVAHRIEIGKGDLGPGRHDQHERIELHVALGHPVGPCEADGTGVGRGDADHGVGDRAALDIADLDHQIASPGKSGQEASGGQPDQDAHG